MAKSQDDQPLLEEQSDHDDQEETAEKIAASAVDSDPRFNPPPPSPWKRLALILLIGVLFYFGFQMRAGLQNKKLNVIYASRHVSTSIGVKLGLTRPFPQVLQGAQIPASRQSSYHRDPQGWSDKAAGCHSSADDFTHSYKYCGKKEKTAKQGWASQRKSQAEENPRCSPAVTH
jgi:hypothetical protein